ncbi:hypothetical protein RRG08_056419, partial [Elysia crispata]
MQIRATPPPIQYQIPQITLTLEVEEKMERQMTASTQNRENEEKCT